MERRGLTRGKRERVKNKKKRKIYPFLALPNK